MFQPTEVENYPDGAGPLRGANFQERFRGAHVLSAMKMAWKSAWPASCAPRLARRTAFILRPPKIRPRSGSRGAERYAKVYNIDYNRCIFCGYCVEACPTDAITHGHGFELATFNATNLVYRKEDMLVPVAALTAGK